MDNDRIKGAAKDVKDTVKEAASKVTGNRQTEAEGKIEKTAGKVQRNVGEAKDQARDLLKTASNPEPVAGRDPTRSPPCTFPLEKTP